LSSETPRVHHLARRRGCGVAARGAGAAGRASASHRRPHKLGGDDPAAQSRLTAFLQGAAGGLIVTGGSAFNRPD